MEKRLDFHEVLVSILGTRNVYFQPPETIKMKYPAIVYSRYDLDKKEADNSVYLKSHLYRVVVIDPDPDSVIVEKLENLPQSRWLSHNIVDNLNQDVFSIYY